ncbi:alpha/beta hydrolase family protein [Parapedobacter indicus]|uniref:4-O-methyl-glucuronoyl methylesterase-like domain-containing protein n=1 Tax=Parapedobacter indicus TaxID=1477437 RepID=A0A1I3TGS1_9SPHI|nr:hypothetical protein [Parapedobacter indicus]PPK99493.1 hypothetical protein CLV26_11211 [Parapedobacter indicus]SFJ70075.1 hypothetical protein SAMN05444682_112170 [Parapedobacter indicus]
MNTIISMLLVAISGTALAQTNYDEANVPPYTLPDPLLAEDGKSVRNISQWEKQRRPEILLLFSQYVYGHTLGGDTLAHKVIAVDKQALGGLATRKEVVIYLTADHSRPLHVLIYLPNNRSGAVPVFMGLNYAGNQGVSADPGIRITTRWTRFAKQPGFPDGYANAQSRGVYASRWPIELILSRGYGIVTSYYGDLQVDRPDIDTMDDSFHRWFAQQTGKQQDSSSWGAIGVWAWGLSRMLDYLEEDRDVDSKRVAVIGHSRLGKTALWAAAQDQRFAMAISNNSGEGGAAIARRAYGERIEDLNRSFPHWFNGNFKQFDGKEDQLPVDFHELLSLIAPRPLYVASGSEDLWADPQGEYLSLYHAGPVYRLYKQPVLQDAEPPVVGEVRTVGNLGYHNRPGKHDINRYDWERYLDFADKHL